MLSLELFRNRAFSAGNAAIFLTFASLFSAVFFYAQFLSRPRLRSARRRPAADAVDGNVHDRRAGGRRAGRPDRERPLMSIGLTLQGAGMIWMAAIAEPGAPRTRTCWRR